MRSEVGVVRARFAGFTLLLGFGSGWFLANQPSPPVEIAVSGASAVALICEARGDSVSLRSCAVQAEVSGQTVYAEVDVIEDRRYLCAVMDQELQCAER